MKSKPATQPIEPKKPSQAELQINGTKPTTKTQPAGPAPSSPSHWLEPGQLSCCQPTDCPSGSAAHSHLAHPLLSTLQGVSSCQSPGNANESMALPGRFHHSLAMVRAASHICPRALQERGQRVLVINRGRSTEKQELVEKHKRQTSSPSPCFIFRLYIYSAIHLSGMEGAAFSICNVSLWQCWQKSNARSVHSCAHQPEKSVQPSLPLISQVKSDRAAKRRARAP